MALADDIKPSARGKVRDLYDLEALCAMPGYLLFVASDRISAFDYVLPDTIPYKGEVLTRISIFWFNLLADVVSNHFISANTSDLPELFKPYAPELAGRFMLVKKATMFPVECIVRGYLAGSGLAEYNKSGSVCGVTLPTGLQESSQFDTPIFTPSTKAELGEHDENISFAKTVDMLGQSDACALRETSLAVYSRARDYAASRGIIIADTKFEFGYIGDAAAGGTAAGGNAAGGNAAGGNAAGGNTAGGNGALFGMGDAARNLLRENGKTIILADEVLTPDSSRFWPAESYTPGKSQPSFDKQFVRDWLSANWDRKVSPQPPHLPKSIIQATSEKYIQAYELLTGEKFVPTADAS
jgi:phosphoribosylaminoimidazole-succinocarboxamide synthase